MSDKPTIGHAAFYPHDAIPFRPHPATPPFNVESISDKCARLEAEITALREVVNSEVQSLRAVQSYVTAHGPQAVAVNLGTILDNLARAARP